jgi:mRNA-degrading endonuclease RelE of RelBE toxin-antitoxin system
VEIRSLPQFGLPNQNLERLGRRPEGRNPAGRGLTTLLWMTIIMVIMRRHEAYTLNYARVVTKHLKSIDAKYDSLIREKIVEQLLFEPAMETKNRKPLKQPAPFGAEWEIRFGPNNRFRVLYDIDEEQHTVVVLAVGEKAGNRLIVAGEEIEL